MFFGLFGSRGTTDDTIEQLEINQAYTRATLDANSNMMRQARNRFLDDWDDDYLEQINKLRDELRAAQRRITDLEKELDGRHTTMFSAFTTMAALRIVLDRQVGEDETNRLERDEVQALLNIPRAVTDIESRCKTYAKTPWKIKAA